MRPHIFALKCELSLLIQNIFQLIVYYYIKKLKIFLLIFFFQL